MSRIGKLPVPIPDKVEASIEGTKVTVKGPNGSLTKEFALVVDITNGEDEAQVVAENLTDNARSIMRNKGGLVAARTMYPIPETKWSDPGHVTAPRHSGHHADPSEGPSWA